MNAAMNLIAYLRVDVGKAESLLVSAEGCARLESAGLKKLALDELNAGMEMLKRARQEIERQMYEEDLNSRCIAELLRKYPHEEEA